MTTLIALYIWLLIPVLLGWMALDHMARRVELVSLRNVFLLGFIVNQLHSTAVALFWGEYGEITILDPSSTGTEYAVLTTVFLGVFFLVYARGRVADALVRWTPQARVEVGDSTLWVLAVLVTLLAFLLRFVRSGSVVDIVNSIWGIAAGAVATGLVGWVWGKRLLNPAAAAAGILIVLVNVGLVVSGSFGRRPLVGVMAALAFGMYMSHWRHHPLPRVVWRLGPVVFVGVTVVALFTSVRQQDFWFRDATSILTSMYSEGSVSAGFTDLSSGQSTGVISLWAIENYPETIDPQPLLSLYYAPLVTVPRAWWPTKPMPLSTQVARLADIPGVNQDGITLPAGIIGTAAAEGGWYAIILYAAAIALVLRYLDVLLWTNADKPLIAIPIASALGQVLGMARGEASVFMNTLMLSVVGVFVFLWLTARVIADPRAARSTPAPPTSPPNPGRHERFP